MQCSHGEFGEQHMAIRGGSGGRAVLHGPYLNLNPPPPSFPPPPPRKKGPLLQGGACGGRGWVPRPDPAPLSGGPGGGGI
eukprot:COSAG05_NODE_14510_length_395_cov_0.469595_1_plen_79_part_10